MVTGFGFEEEEDAGMGTVFASMKKNMRFRLHLSVANLTLRRRCLVEVTLGFAGKISRRSFCVVQEYHTTSIAATSPHRSCSNSFITPHTITASPTSARHQLQQEHH
jgi:hypothetical protein